MAVHSLCLTRSPYTAQAKYQKQIDAMYADLKKAEAAKPARE